MDTGISPGTDNTGCTDIAAPSQQSRQPYFLAERGVDARQIADRVR